MQAYTYESTDEVETTVPAGNLAPRLGPFEYFILVITPLQGSPRQLIMGSRFITAKWLSLEQAK